jgi:hypothetical protein
MSIDDNATNKSTLEVNLIGKRSGLENKNVKLGTNPILTNENISISCCATSEKSLKNASKYQDQIFVESDNDDFEKNIFEIKDKKMMFDTPKFIDLKNFYLFEKCVTSSDIIPKQISNIIDEAMQESSENEFKINTKKTKRLKKYKEIKKSQVHKEIKPKIINKKCVQKRIFPIEQNKQIDINNKNNQYSFQELENVFRFIQTYVHFDKPNGEDAFNELSQNSKTFLGYYLKKVYSLKTIPKQLSFTKFCEIKIKNKKKRRNEEKLKVVYKSALREFRKQFDAFYTILLTQAETEDLKKLYMDKEVGFHVWMFKETILNKREHVDFILDICFGKFGPKTINFSRKDGWRMAKSNKGMIKISRTYRYLVKQDQTYKKKFLEYLNFSSERGMISKFKSEIIEKLNKKLSKLKNVLGSVHFEFDKFIRKFREIMNNKKYKNPWLMKDVKESIDYCLFELEQDFPHLEGIDFYSDLNAEYHQMKQKHYAKDE